MLDDDHERRAHERVGTTLNGKYRLEAVIGVGGMAAVYRATHRNRAEVAVKILHPELSHSLDVRTRFLREGYSANSVRHPGVVRVNDDEIAEDGSAFLVMELLDGMSLEDLWVGFARKLPLGVVLEVALQLLDVLAAAHDASVVHRDIKPANLFLTRDGTLKVLDFGVARIREQVPSASGATGAGLPIGTPSYMAPEQALGRSAEVGPATDLWAVGATVFALLSGETVHVAVTASEMLVHAATRPARLLHQASPEVPVSIAEVVDRALAFGAGARWPSARAMRDALEQASLGLAGGPPSRDTLKALFPKQTSLAPRERLSMPVTSELASAPTVNASEPPSPLSGATTLPLASTRRPVPPPARWFRRPGAVGTLALLVLSVAFGGVWLRARAHRRAVASQGPHDVTPAPWAQAVVIVLGSENLTNDPALDGTLELVLGSALKRSPGLNPYAGKDMRALVTELAPTAGGVDAEIGRIVAQKMHVPVALVHVTVAPMGAGFAVSLVATNGTTGARIAELKEEASSRERIVASVAGLGCSLRDAVRDAPCDARARDRVGMSSSVDAVHEYMLGTSQHASGKYAEAELHLRTAVELDPGFAMAHTALGILFLNLHRPEEGRGQLKVALAHRAQLSDREWLQLTATNHLLMDEYDEAAQAYEELLARWPLQTLLRGNLAAVYSEAGDLDRALSVGRQAAEEHPDLIHSAANVPAYLLLRGDLDEAARAMSDVLRRFPHPTPTVYSEAAAIEVLQGRRGDAMELLRKLETTDPSAGVFASADFAMFEGRLLDAETSLKRGIADDEKASRDADAQTKWATLAEIALRRGNLAAARDAAARAARSNEIVTLVRAARVLASAGKPAEASTLERIIAAHPGMVAPVYARIVAANVALATHGTKDAVAAAMGEVGTGPGSWLGHADLGAAYLALGDYDAAHRELEQAVATPGSASMAFFDDTPTLRYLPPARHALARAKEALGRPDAREAYKAFLSGEPDAQSNPLEVDAKKRLRP